MTTIESITTTIEVSAPERYAFLDLTEDLERAIKDSGVTEGCAVAFCAHTTVALLINELEDGAMEDLRGRLDAVVPGDCYYAHDDLDIRTQNLVEDEPERPNGRSHVTAMIVGGTSHAIPVADGEPMFGRWQRLLLLELDEPKDRDVIFHVFGG